jgi:hypothetical protein
LCITALTAQEADPVKIVTPPQVPIDAGQPPVQASAAASNDSAQAAAPAAVQDPDSSEAEEALPAVSPTVPAYVPLDLTQKFLYSFNEMMGPPRLIGLTVKAAMDQAQKSPNAWGSGVDSFGVRVASRFGRAFLREDIAFGVRAFDHEDPRYFRAGIGTGQSRTKSALYQTFMARKDNVPGGSTWIPAYSRFLSDFAMPFLAQTWRPEPLNVARGFRQGSLAIGMTFGSNLWQEFWPDIRKRFKILRHAPTLENGVLVPAPSVP